METYRELDTSTPAPPRCVRNYKWKAPYLFFLEDVGTEIFYIIVSRFFLYCSISEHISNMLYHSFLERQRSNRYMTGAKYGGIAHTHTHTNKHMCVCGGGGGKGGNMGIGANICHMDFTLFFFINRCLPFRQYWKPYENEKEHFLLASYFENFEI